MSQPEQLSCGQAGDQTFGISGGEARLLRVGVRRCPGARGKRTGHKPHAGPWFRADLHTPWTEPPPEAG